MKNTVFSEVQLEKAYTSVSILGNTMLVKEVQLQKALLEIRCTPLGKMILVSEVQL